MEMGERKKKRNKYEGKDIMGAAAFAAKVVPDKITN